MLIPTKRRKLLRKYEGALFYGEPFEGSRTNGFYSLLRPTLEWLKNNIKSEFDLEDAEIESEIFLFTVSLFKRYNKEKSSIIPYLEKHIPWAAANLIKSLEKKTLRELLTGDSEQLQGFYNTYEEYYFLDSRILTEQKYVGKCFTRAEKYVIFTVLTSDDKDLSHQRLADTCNMERKRMRNILSDIREVLGGYNVRQPTF